MYINTHDLFIFCGKQVELITELEERLPAVRRRFFKKSQTHLKKHYDRISPLMFFRGTLDDKVQAVKDSKEHNSSVIEEYQVTSQLAILLLAMLMFPYIEGKSNRRNQRKTSCTR